MIRECNLEDISDGRRYTSNDLVKLGCNECEGCSHCCRGMDDTISLDPYDICMLTRATGKEMAQLMQAEVALHVESGVIVPHLQMTNDNHCPFLNEAGRCRVHESRPGICRLFPLGRVYEGDSFQYFLQTNECVKKDRTKVRIREWLGISNLREYEAFIAQWHSHMKALQSHPLMESDAQALNLKHLQLFYFMPYSSVDTFLTEISKRLEQWECL
ncbi:MAG: YkgJ family cysteine cluster protein [Lachnospiraceae bacterium]|nr:YkgJ family cysteine cluster protein [Lachnospiraceae bacterium]